MMALNFLLLLSGPGPVPAEYGGEPWWLTDAVPFLLAGTVVAALIVSALFRYSESFREFWATHVCAFMEEHAVNSEDTKGGV
jgi:hypothetical protein